MKFDKIAPGLFVLLCLVDVIYQTKDQWAKCPCTNLVFGDFSWTNPMENGDQQRMTRCYKDEQFVLDNEGRITYRTKRCHPSLIERLQDIDYGLSCFKSTDCREAIKSSVKILILIYLFVCGQPTLIKITGAALACLSTGGMEWGSLIIVVCLCLGVYFLLIHGNIGFLQEKQTTIDPIPEPKTPERPRFRATGRTQKKRYALKNE